MPAFEAPSETSRYSSLQPDGRYSAQTLPPNTRHLHPEDAYGSAISSPRSRSVRSRSPLGRSDTVTTATAGPSEARKKRDKRRGRSSSRRRIRPWKKLLWVKQSYPDNYTDEETFLDHLQRNPRLRPYEFWPLVADSTIIVQHVCSVVIFVCCFTGIFQERVSPTTVVGWATSSTVASWVLGNYWQSRQEEEDTTIEHASQSELASNDSSDKASSRLVKGLSMSDIPQRYTPTSFTVPSTLTSRTRSRSPSETSNGSPNLSTTNGESVGGAAPSYPPPYATRASKLSPRMKERLTTAKSAILIYFSLLGLSPILKSLTKSTSSDSIWALSSWLMGINVFTFDYGAGAEAK